MNQKPNKLITEKSQYLLQHAYNPVDWYPWCEEAFEKAKQEDKPIFLSIGYSTCHWCHVMEKESFEDFEVAKLMNETFISIKVDREERPDIDGVYMKVCQMLTGSGGWPLTIIMTPDKKPFFAGTYFPKRQRFNRIGMLELIPKIKEFWISKRKDILQSAEEITKSLNFIGKKNIRLKLDDSIFEKAYQQFENRFDPQYGGFGEAPKFPSPHNLLFLMRFYKNKNLIEALNMVEKTLTQIRLGGIFDHIGFGFCRYSTDKFWLVPHFEKMLYDQAMLLMAYSEAFQVTKNELFEQTAREIISYVFRVLKNNIGGFFTAEDADSEGEEGKFYLFTEKEIAELIPKDFYQTFVKIFNIEKGGNYYDESKGVKTGKNILHLKKALREISNETGYNYNYLSSKLEQCRNILFDYREKRTHPLRDEKILTDWNSLIISALVKAYQVLGDDEYLNIATQSYDFIIQNLLLDNKLYHRYKDEEVKFDGNLDDYAFFIQTNLDLFETTSEVKYLSTALELNQILTNNFWDELNGGYFFTSSNSEKLISRQKELYDGAIPSGNSVQFMNLIKLYRLTQEKILSEMIEKQIEYFSSEVEKYPSAYSYFLCALQNYYSPSTEIIISGPNEEVKNATKEILRLYIPNKILITISPQNQNEIVKLIPQMENYISEKLNIFICNNFVCKNPIDKIELAIKELTNSV